MEEVKTAEITQELDRTYKTVLNFVHEVQDVLDDDPKFDLTGVCEADELYVVAGEKGLDQDEPRDRGLKKGTRNLRVRQTASRDTRPSPDGRVRFLVRKDLEDVEEEIVERSSVAVNTL
jgi:hypothetical protein